MVWLSRRRAAAAALVPCTALRAGRRVPRAARISPVSLRSAPVATRGPAAARRWRARVARAMGQAGRSAKNAKRGMKVAERGMKVAEGTTPLTQRRITRAKGARRVDWRGEERGPRRSESGGRGAHHAGRRVSRHLITTAASRGEAGWGQRRLRRGPGILSATRAEVRRSRRDLPCGAGDLRRSRRNVFRGQN